MSFNNIVTPQDFLAASFIALDAAEMFSTRLQWLIHEPSVVVCMGVGAHKIAAALTTIYTNATTIIVETQEPLAYFSKPQIIASSSSLPFKFNTIDLLCLNFLIQQEVDIATALKNVKSYLAKDSVMALTCFGPDTLKECQSLFAKEVMPTLIDMHDLGDLLLQLGFAEPVLEVEQVAVTYRDINQLASDLFASGMVHLSYDHILQQVQTLPKDAEDKWTMTYEIVFAHAFHPLNATKPSEDGFVSFPISALRRRG